MPEYLLAEGASGMRFQGARCLLGCREVASHEPARGKVSSHMKLALPFCTGSSSSPRGFLGPLG